MAGTIEIRPGVRWSAAGWLFDWVLSTAASEISDAEFAGKLREIVDENLGFLALSEITGDQRSEFRSVVAVRLSDVATTSWRDFTVREDALRHLNELRKLIG